LGFRAIRHRQKSPAEKDRGSKLKLHEAKGILELCTRSYWRRVWIIQEILSASELEIVSATNCMPWSHFSTRVKCILERVPILDEAHSFTDTSASISQARSSSPSAKIHEHYNRPGGTYSFKKLLGLCYTCGSKC